MKRTNIICIPLICVLFSSGCGNIFMTAEDRFDGQSQFQEVAAEGGLSDDKIQCFAYPDLPISRYQLEEIAPAISGINVSQVMEVKQEDEWGTQWLKTNVDGEDVDFGILTDGSGFYYSSFFQSRNYYDAISQVIGFGERSFELLTSFYPKTEITDFPFERARQICDRAVSEANLPLTFERYFAMDSESMNALQRRMSEEYGVWRDHCGAPGSTDKNVLDWEQDQDAYALFYRADVDGIPLSSPHFDQTYSVFICRRDGKIVYAMGNTAVFHLDDSVKQEQQGISTREIWRIAQREVEEGQELQSITQHLQIQSGTETTRSLVPVWAIKYTTEVQGQQVADYFYLDAVTGKRVNPRNFY